jgi:predicted NAD-dependent protein-ADP-ribosyltransferase YbiA (DUF1768 family)
MGLCIRSTTKKYKTKSKTKCRTKCRTKTKNAKKTIKKYSNDDKSMCLKSGVPLYNNSVVFQYYSKSKDNELPGMGAGEKIKHCDVSKYEKLSSIPNWRKMLSNFWEPPGNDKTKSLFTLGGHKWRTVQHYLQGIKYMKENPKYYREFSLDSGSAFCKNPLLAKKMYKDIPSDTDFKMREEAEREKALYAKYSQNIYLKNMLLNTLNAKLVHFRRGKPPLISNELMRVRQKLRKEVCKDNN